MSQDVFTRAVLDPDLPVPEGLIGPDGGPAGARFSVYRNNVVVGLTEALATAFPVLCKLLGQEYFDALAGVFLRQNPPKTPLLMHYGAALLAFIEGFQPLAHLGYLPDIARLEQNLREAYHAADATPLAQDAFAIAPDRLMASRVQFAPAVWLIRSRWPIHSIWRSTTDPDAAAPAPCGEDVLIARPEFDAKPYLLPTGGGAVVEALMAGATLGHAFSSHETDASALIATLINARALTDLKDP